LRRGRPQPKHVALAMDHERSIRHHCANWLSLRGTRARALYPRPEGRGFTAHG
jgi:hypothetical protein